MTRTTLAGAGDEVPTTFDGGVSVPGCDRSNAAVAVDLAAGEAQRRERGPVVVHAFDWALTDDLNEDEFHCYVEEQLADLAMECRRTGHPVVGLLRHGHRPPVRPVGHRPVRPVVVGVDGSQASQPAIGFAFDFAARHGCALHAVITWHDTQLGQGAHARWAKHGEGQALALAIEVAEQLLAEWAQRYPDVPVEVECVAQRPTQALLERAETARLLVVGGRGHGVTRPGQLGTVSRAVLYDAACSVAVLRGHVASDRS